MAAPYRIGAVSKLTGIGVDTLRAWERRYSAVTPKRGGKIRTYDRSEVDRLILLRRAVERGHPISSVASLSDHHLRGLLAERRGSEAPVLPAIGSLLALLEDFDYAGLNSQLRRMAALLAPADLVNDAIVPLMREVGERWHRGRLTIAQEHMMTGLTHHVLGTLLGLYQAAPHAPKMICTTPEGELHSLGILAAAALAAGEGLSPIYLGPSLPPKEIVHAARRSGARVVVMQITDPAVEAESQVRQVRRGLAPNVELWLGGPVDVKLPGTLHILDFSSLRDHCKRVAAS